ncbi:hypothetical protein ANN_12406 [Periplaneta americana]|uniref:Transposase n=1 Tax=Periplaneta americana TaxID=6978 RepID=A0ABQ8TGE9_PERAM|nr:hypothetical protein ANN_12406 [Periplaneta americana]
MAQRCQLDPVLKGRIMGCLEGSQTQTEVSRLLNVGQSVISRLWRRFEDTGDVRRMPVQGRPQIKTQQKDLNSTTLTNDSHRTGREHGTRFHPTNIVKKRSFGGGGILVWAGIIFNAHIDLHIFAAGTVNAQRYRDEIQPGGRVSRGEDIQRMDWPAMSPDLNPIEHAWYTLGRRVATRQPLPRTL